MKIISNIAFHIFHPPGILEFTVFVGTIPPICFTRPEFTVFISTILQYSYVSVYTEHLTVEVVTGRTDLPQGDGYQRSMVQWCSYGRRYIYVNNHA